MRAAVMLGGLAALIVLVGCAVFLRLPWLCGHRLLTALKRFGRTQEVKLCRSSPSRLLPAGTLVGVLLTLRVLAYANPPDPTWIAGFWDDADYDDVVILITSTSGIADANPFVEVKPLRLFIGSLPTDDPQSVPAQASSFRHSRAPPAA